jgi:hypothetical protein
MNSIWKCGFALAVLLSLSALADWEPLDSIPYPYEC